MADATCQPPLVRLFGSEMSQRVPLVDLPPTNALASLPQDTLRSLPASALMQLPLSTLLVLSQAALESLPEDTILHLPASSHACLRPPSTAFAVSTTSTSSTRPRSDSSRR